MVTTAAHNTRAATAAPAPAAAAAVPGATTARAASAAAIPATTPAAAASTAGANRWPPLGLRVLYADDEATNRRLFARMMGRLGCEAVTLEDGDQVIPTLTAAAAPTSTSSATSTAFDVIFLDIVMVRSDGSEVCRQLRSRGHYSGPIHAATGNSHHAELLAAGFNSIVSKPFDLKSLYAILQQIAEEKRQRVPVTVPVTATAGDASATSATK